MAFPGTIINLINQSLIAFITITLSWRCFQLKLQKTAMHAYLCTLGFVCLFSEGLMVRYNNVPFTTSWDSDSKDRLQFILQLVGGFLGIAGTLQKYWGKETHFKSLHAKWGLATCVFCSINFICGFIALYSPYYRGYYSTYLTHFVHDFLGLLTFMAAMVAQYYSYETGFFRRNCTNKELYKFLTFVVFVLTAFLPFQILLKKVYKMAF